MSTVPAFVDEDRPAASAGGRSDAILSDRYEVFPGERLPQFDPPGCSAFRAADLKGRPRALFAVICAPNHPPRTEAISVLRRFPSLPILAPVDAGFFHWPPAGASRAVLIFEQPAGPRLVDTCEARFEPWREDHVVEMLIRPLLPAIRELERYYLPHRAVRPDNMFFSDGTATALMLGECLSTQAGFGQPVLYEPVDSALAMPGGRGDRTTSDDLYALGVVIAVLLNGGNPLAALSDEEIILSKATQGSFIALAQHLRCSLPMVEVLRGLLSDDPDDRWTVNDIALWLNGRRLSPKQPVLAAKATRGFEFEGQSYTNGPSLAVALATHWDSALEVVKSGKLLIWAERSLNDGRAVQRLQSALENWAYGEGGVDSEHHVLARVIMALNPRGSVCYKNFRASIDGIHKALALGFRDPEVCADYKMLVLGRLAPFWYSIQSQVRPEYAAHRKYFDLARRLIAQGSEGFGLVRSIYATNPGWPCQSDIFAGDYVASPGDIVMALEKVAASENRPTEPLDDHVVGFVASNFQGLSDIAIASLTRQNRTFRYVLDMIELLSALQRASGPVQAPRLTQWLSTSIGPVLETYHNRETRRQIEKSVAGLVPEGNLSRLLETVDDLNLKEADGRGFARAQAQFLQLTIFRRWIEAGGHGERAFLSKVAHPIGSGLTAVVGAVALLIMTVAHL
jgi:hypothetical protein